MYQQKMLKRLIIFKRVPTCEQCDDPSLKVKLDKLSGISSSHLKDFKVCTTKVVIIKNIYIILRQQKPKTYFSTKFIGELLIGALSL